jgi:HNH endonuclease
MSVLADRTDDAHGGRPAQSSTTHRRALEVHHVVKRAQGGSDFDLDRLVALCPRCHAQTDAPYVHGRLVVMPSGSGRFIFELGAETGKERSHVVTAARPCDRLEQVMGESARSRPDNEITPDLVGSGRSPHRQRLDRQASAKASD